VNGDELKLAVPETGERCGRDVVRPKAVASVGDECAILLVLKKAPPTTAK